jgi:acetyltransferase-like isoleucine patch superfamily enzyme
MTLIQRLLFGLRWQRTFVRRRVAGWFFRVRCLLGGAYVAGGAQIAGRGRITVEPGVVIHSRAFLFTRDSGAIFIGSNSRIGSDATIGAAGHVHIGEGVLIAARCMIADYSHEFSSAQRPVMDQGSSSSQPVRIGDGSWIGINACILPGVNLGNNCVVGANCVVTRSFADGSVVGGVPAKLLKSLPTTTSPAPSNPAAGRPEPPAQS